MTTNPTDPLFTRDDLAHVLNAHGLIRDFERFVLRRFADYTRFAEVRDNRGQVVEPVADAFARTNSGYGHWRIPQNWIQDVTSSVLDADGSSISVEHYLADDRGPGMVTATVKVPLRFLFGEAETDAEYAEFLRLKARFEPAAPEPVAEADDVVVRDAAQRMLYVLPPDQRIPVEEMLADKQVAARVYRAALTVAEQMGEDAGDLSSTSRMRMDIHAHANALGLSRDALDEPQPPSKKAREAARVLWVQSQSHRGRFGNGEHLADPANREQAAEAYRDALRRLGESYRPGLKDVRRQVHDAAKTLGLGEADLKTPKPEQTASPYDDPRAGKQADPSAAQEDPEKVTSDLGYTLLNDLTERLFGGRNDEAHTPDAARRAYEKTRAVLTLSGKDVFGDHADQVVSVVDDVASLLGLKKK